MLLAYLFYSRQEMGQGRVPAAQEMLLGRPASHPRRLRGRADDFGERKRSAVGQGDLHLEYGLFRLTVSMSTMPATPPGPRCCITAPFAMGRFSMELIR